MDAIGLKGAEKVRFQPKKEGDFYSVLKKRVDEYFKDKPYGFYANGEMIRKIYTIGFIYFINYLLILSNDFSFPVTCLLFASLGILTAIFGFNLGHDSLHGAFSRHPWMNRLLGHCFDCIGLSTHVWRATHNVAHHTYTNIAGHDNDIDKAILLRLSPQDEYWWFHRFQHIYAPILYCFTSLNWTFYSDYLLFFEEYKKGRVTAKDISIFFGFKMLHIALFIALPILCLSLPIWQIFVAFLCMQFAGGFMTAVIFQLAHIVENVEYPLPDDKGHMARSWAVHELVTTSNFANNNKFVNYAFGGLNFQIEHHLFPYVCHIHYRALSEIVNQTTKEFGLTYNCYPSFTSACCSHLRLLKQLGRQQ